MLGRCSWLKCPPKPQHTRVQLLTVNGDVCRGTGAGGEHSGRTRTKGGLWGTHGVHAAEKPQDQPHQGWLLPPLALSRGNHMLKVTLIECEG